MSNIKFCKDNDYVAQGYVAVIDGAKCKCSSEFLQAIWGALKFPGLCNNKWTAYSDWMRDLEWIDENDITIVIRNYADFLSAEPQSKEYFISSLQEVIFPYWENDAMDVLESKDGIKNITVICTDSQDDTVEIVPTENIVDIFAEKALNGRKTPHSVSVPVLRVENGDLFLSAFVFFYNREQFQSSMIKRPSMWILADLITGEISARYSCQDKDFSALSHEKLYNISDDDLPDLPEGYWEALYAMLDEIRSEYAQTHKLNNSLYNQYLEKILASTPSEYRVFYEELSCISIKEELSMDENTQETKEVIEQRLPDEPLPAHTDFELRVKLDAVQQAVAALQQTFNDKIAEDAHKNGLFDNMHRELVRYQNGALDKIVDTIALDIIQLVDTTKGHVRVYDKKEPSEENYKKLLRIVKGIAEDLEDILYRQNIESYRVPGHEVDTRRQKIIQTIPTDDKSKDNLVAVRAADGYEKGDKVLRPERIKIFKYEASSEAPAEN